MSDAKRPSGSPSEIGQQPPGAGSHSGVLAGLLDLSARLRAWAAAHWVRSMLVGGTLVVLIASTMAAWAYLASVALEEQRPSIELALRALDEGRWDDARAFVDDMLASGKLHPSDFGGPLYVLGVIKTQEAEKQPSADRSRAEYLIASRYLTEANAFGFPPGREADGLFLLGKSLIETSQFENGIYSLDALLRIALPAEHPRMWEAHRLLANTFLYMPESQPQQALAHAIASMSYPQITEEQRADVLLQQAECLLRLERFAEARQAVEPLTTNADRLAEVELMRGKVALLEATRQVQNAGATGADAAAAAGQIDDAMQRLQRAMTLDEGNIRLARHASYHLGLGMQAQGRIDEALKQFAITRQHYGGSSEAFAAAIAEADLLRQKGDFEGALVSYRRSLESLEQAADYRSDVMPLSQARERLMAAERDLLRREQYGEALALLEQFSPVFSEAEQLEFRGTTLEQWGNQLLRLHDGSNEPDAQSQRSIGRHHLRAAGLAFEQLANLRFATRFYVSDLWRSADNYFRGHCFSRALDVLNLYLDNEPESRRAEALLRIGQAKLALGQTQASIDSFEECIEFYPQESAAYQARIDCAKAHWRNRNVERAEALLRENIAGSLLTPRSNEWKDSNFELGILLYETGRYDEAIGILEDTMERYPDDPQQLMAQYVIGDAYRLSARALLAGTRQARTASERSKLSDDRNTRLTLALSNYDEVQRSITLRSHDIQDDAVMGAMLRNCYMFEGTVLFEMGRYKEAIESFSNVASLYPDDPFVLETYVQIANCWRRLEESDKARGAIEQAQIQLDRLPAEADFLSATAFSRDEWRMLLADMSRW